MNGHKFSYIDSDTALHAAATRWRNCDVVGIDTEFIRTRTFYPIAALYQVAAGDEFALLDPLAVARWEAFAALLTDTRVVKVMHACSEDLEVFARHLNVMPVNLFDTQVAEGFLSTHYSPSYANLVQRYAGVEIVKHETRSDWLARPLRAEQLDYAVGDVAHLLKVYDAQRTQLEAMGRWDWFVEEMHNRVGYSAVDPDICYRNIARAWRCDARALARLQLVCAWRERYAREKDLPRGRVVKDDELVELVCQPAVGREVITRMLEPASARRHGQELTALIAQADALPETALPKPLPAPLTSTETRAVKALKSVAVEAARALNIAEELLSRRRDLELCLRSVRGQGALPASFLGWRHALVGEKFKSLLNGVAT